MAPLLYKMDASPTACAVRMLADIIGLQLELKDLNILTMENKSSEYLKLNPLGTIPALVDGDLAISDSHAIMIYLLSKYGGDKSELWYPSDVRTRALINQVLFFDTGVFFIKMKVVVLPTLLEGLKGPTARHLSDIEEAYGMVEEFLSRNKYIAADHMTIADLSVGTTLAATQAICKLNVEKLPRTAQWYAGLEQESFFKAIMTPGAAAFENALQMCWENNNKQ